MRIGDRAIDSPEKTLNVEPDFVFLRAVAMVYQARLTAAAGAERTDAIDARQVHGRAECGVYGTRHARREHDLVNDVTISLVKLDRFAVEREDLVGVIRLKNAHEGLQVQMLVDDDDTGHRALDFLDVEEAGGAEYSNSVLRVRPELIVGGEPLERLQQLADVSIAPLLVHCIAELPQQVSILHRILLRLGKRPVRRLIE